MRVYYEEKTKEEKIKLARLTRFLEKKEDEIYKRDRHTAVCPNCHMVIPTNGICNCEKE